MRRLVGFGAIALCAAACHARALGPDDVDRLPASKPIIIQYGPGSLQKGELRLPSGKGPFPVAIVIHGGCWTSGLATERNTAAMASALAAKGIATWNIEYRQLGDTGGGWPGTFQDWGKAADELRILAKQYPLNLSRVAAVGHSAGAHAALWLAARPRVRVDSDIGGTDPLPIKAAIAIDGPGDLAALLGQREAFCRHQSITRLMGGTPADQPRHYDEGSPAGLLPLGVTQYLVAGEFVGPDAARSYAETARAKGDHVTILAPKQASHFNLIAPGEPQFAAVAALVLKALQ